MVGIPSFFIRGPANCAKVFKSTEQIKKDNPELPAFETYDELMKAIKAALADYKMDCIAFS